MNGALPGSADLRVALVHYWLVNMRGGERVLEQLCELFPQAVIYTLVCDREKLSPLLQSRKIHTSFLDRLPGARRHYAKLLPLMPFALEEFDLQSYDLVISSESGPAKGVITSPGATHICYCHSPMRYIWDHYHIYRREQGLAGRMMMSAVAPALRTWDVTTSARVDAFVANSRHVANRIARFYNRAADVIHPPVAVGDFSPSERRDDFYLCAGQIVPYKRIDLAVRAFSRSGRRLVVIGDGDKLDRLRQQAGPTVTLLGYQPFEVLRDHLARCRALLFPGEEDFGILPVEAMASGRPVIAFGAGGICETVTSARVGVLFAEQTEDSLLEAVDRFESLDAAGQFESELIVEHVRRFSPCRFREQMGELIWREIMAKRRATSVSRSSAWPDVIPPVFPAASAPERTGS